MNRQKIEVSLGAHRTLTVKPDCCEIEMDANQPSLIVWELTGVDPDVHFVRPKDHDGPGLAWNDGKTLAHFKNLCVEETSISIEDHHFGQTTVDKAGRPYTLRVKKGTILYRTAWPAGGDRQDGTCRSPSRGKDPVIINK